MERLLFLWINFLNHFFELGVSCLYANKAARKIHPRAIDQKNNTGKVGAG